MTMPHILGINNETRLRRLRRLHDVVLPNIPPERFDIYNWYVESKGCGFVACAMGWAAQDPVLQGEGLRLIARPPFGVGMKYMWPTLSAGEFFGLTNDEFEDTFCPKGYEQVYPRPAGPTPLDVQAKVAKLIEKYAARSE